MRSKEFLRKFISRISYFFIILISIFIAQACTTLPPDEEILIPYSIKVDTIPSGARVFENNIDTGQMGRFLGDTPIWLTGFLATSVNHYSSSDYKEAVPKSESELSESDKNFLKEDNGGVTIYPSGSTALLTLNPYHVTLRLDISIIKEGYQTERINQNFILPLDNNYTPKPFNYEITKQLIEKVNNKNLSTNIPSVPQQQQQQQQQTLIFTNNPLNLSADQNNFGNIHIISIFAGDEIFIDTIFVGNPPGDFLLKEGLHKIEIKRNGSYIYQKEVNILKGANVTINIDK